MPEEISLLFQEGKDGKIIGRSGVRSGKIAFVARDSSNLPKEGEWWICEVVRDNQNHLIVRPVKFEWQFAGNIRTPTKNERRRMKYEEDRRRREEAERNRPNLHESVTASRHELVLSRVWHYPSGEVSIGDESRYTHILEWERIPTNPIQDVPDRLLEFPEAAAFREQREYLLHELGIILSDPSRLEELISTIPPEPVLPLKQYDIPEPEYEIVNEELTTPYRKEGDEILEEWVEEDNTPPSRAEVEAASYYSSSRSVYIPPQRYRMYRVRRDVKHVTREPKVINEEERQQAKQAWYSWRRLLTPWQLAALFALQHNRQPKLWELGNFFPVPEFSQKKYDK